MWRDTPPPRHMHFVIEDVRQAPAAWAATPDFAGLDAARAVLEEAGKVASQVPAPTDAAAALQGCRRRDGEACTPDGQAQPCAACAQGGWPALPATRRRRARPAGAAGGRCRRRRRALAEPADARRAHTAAARAATATLAAVAKDDAERTLRAADDRMRGIGFTPPARAWPRRGTARTVNPDLAPPDGCAAAASSALQRRFIMPSSAAKGSTERGR
jgi:hypothetical protein